METRNDENPSDPPPPLFEDGLNLVTHKKQRRERKKISNFTVEKPSKYNLNQVIRLPSSRMSCGYQVTPDIMG